MREGIGQTRALFYSMLRMRFLPGLFCLLLALPALADSAAQAISGNEISLADGRNLHLEGIEQPFAGDWRDQAQKFLQDLVAGHQIISDSATTDRYGRLSAQAYELDQTGKKIWLQGEMLKRGVAFVYPPTGFEARLDEMLALEAAARRARTGIWNDSAYADIPADQLSTKEGQFVFAGGTVLNSWRAKNMVYIHFGEDWHDTLTIAIAAHDLHNFRRAAIDPLELKGKTIRVRGWIKHDIGPMIMVTDPAQMEVIR